VRSLLTDREIEVQYVFINGALAELLLSAARADGEDPALLARAAVLLRQPAGVDPHDDHMHVRVACAVGDRALGCLDQSAPRAKTRPKKHLRAKSLRRRHG
jgi:penicillin-insensitive murein endopeptidase